MFSRFKKNRTPRIAPRAPEGTRIYAVGDIHGRLDLLKKLHTNILQDSISAGSNTRKILIYVGDYVDRGLESKQVIDFLINNNVDGFEQVFLKGNHEDAMLKFLENSEIGELWIAWGGYATVQGYGVSLSINGKKLSMEELRGQFSNAVPSSHIEFLNGLKIYHVEGDYLFVHAGIKPGVELEKQTSEDMMMIREEFIYSEYPSIDKTVVFGHTIFEEPFIKSGKIAIDTGAYATGKLTCAVLEGDSVRFLST